MSEKHYDALMRLADAYADATFDQGLHQRTEDPAPEIAREALAAELRRLHALNWELLEALKKMLGYGEHWPNSFAVHDCWKKDANNAREAIAKAKAEAA